MAVYRNCSVPAAFVAFAVATVNPMPAVTDDMYNDFAEPCNVPAEAFLACRVTMELDCISGWATAKVAVAVMVNVPLIRAAAA